jgi:hypothetical protein
MAEHIDSKGQKDCVTDDQRQFMSGKIARALARMGTPSADAATRRLTRNIFLR